MERVGSVFPTGSGLNWLRSQIKLRSYEIITFIAMAVIIACSVYLVLHPEPVYAATVSLPGDDASDKLQAAGTLLKVIDTGIFQWGARIFAGICLLSSGWAFKEQRFGVAVVCILGAILIGTAPAWVSNIFDIGGNQSLFSENAYQYAPRVKPYPGAWASCPNMRAYAELPES